MFSSYVTSVRGETAAENIDGNDTESRVMNTIKSLIQSLWQDEHGFIVSAEIILVGTIGVLSMVVGLSTVSRSITNELDDMADAFNSVNQGNDSGRGQGRRRDRNRFASNDRIDASDIVAR